MKSEKFATALVRKVQAYIEREIGLEVPSLNSEIYVALSGGADSTALLLILKELGFGLHALHCNFHLRGEESNRDQAFVEKLCKKQGVPLSVRHFETEKVAKERGISIEMAARDLRYEWFLEERRVKSEELRVKNNSNNQATKGNSDSSLFTLHSSLQYPIAVAHHRDDQAETLLLNLARGTGLRGMAGMQPVRDGIIRPLLCLTRKEILDYLESQGQSFVTDSTNSERVALRNRIRLDVIPLLRDINPSAVEHLCLACDNVRESLPYFIKGIEAAFEALGITADTFPLKALRINGSGDSTRTLLHEWLAGKGFNQAQEEEISALASPFKEGNQVGRLWNSRTHTVLCDRDALLLAPHSSSIVNCPLSIKEEVVPCIGETSPSIAYFDADLLTAPIEVRPVREGDAFVPFGMRGRKLVSDFLTDRKVNRLRKAETFVATCADDIIWLIGHRSDNRFRVTDKTTRILKLTCTSPTLP